MRKKIKISSIFQYLFLGIASIFSIFPFYWLVVGSTNNNTDILGGKLSVGKMFFENYNNLIKFGGFGKAFLNTLEITVIYMILTLLITALAAYGFDKFKTLKTEIIYKIFLLSMMVPFAAMMNNGQIKSNR